MIKGIERVTPILKFSPRAVEVRIHGVRQDAPPRMESISYEIIVDTDEPNRRLDLLHYNVKQYGTVFNTVAPGRCSLACAAQPVAEVSGQALILVRARILRTRKLDFEAGGLLMAARTSVVHDSCRVNPASLPTTWTRSCT